MPAPVTITATLAAVAVVAGGFALAQTAVEESAAETDPPFGGPANVAYAGELWSVLEEQRLVGPQSIWAVPYQGQEPHGAILITLEGEVTVGDHTGPALVKKNYGGEGLTVGDVSDNPDENLGAITVMYQRAEGYDPDNQNWYWVRYNADGSLAANEQGMELAGRIAKGADQGCIACHEAAPGDDYIYAYDRAMAE